MTSQNTEFTKKLRAAVKAKLEEFGLDVDEELPDYVMIMVGNKKDKARMKSDLKLFLGTNTTDFVDWLFGFFQKVKTVSSNKDGDDENKKNQPETTSTQQQQQQSTSKNIPSDNTVKHSNRGSREETQLSSKKEESRSTTTTKHKHKSSSTSRSNHRETLDDLHQKNVVEITPEHDIHNDEIKKESRRITFDNSSTTTTTKMMESKSGRKRRSDTNDNNLPDMEKLEVKKERKKIRYLPEMESENDDDFEKITSSKNGKKHSSKHSKSKKNETKSKRKNVRSEVVVKQCERSPSPPKLNSKVVVLRKTHNEEQRHIVKGTSSIFKKAISDAASISTTTTNTSTTGCFSRGAAAANNIPIKEKSPENIEQVNLYYEEKLPNERSTTIANKTVPRFIVTVKNSTELIHKDLDSPPAPPPLPSTTTTKTIAISSTSKTNENFKIISSNGSPNLEPTTTTKPKTMKKQIISFEKKEYSEISEEDYCIKNLSDSSTTNISSNYQENQLKSSTNVSHNKTQLLIASNKMLADYKRKRKAENLTRAFLKLSGINPRIGGAHIEKDSKEKTDLKKLKKCLLNLKNENDIKTSSGATISTTTTTTKIAPTTSNKIEVVEEEKEEDDDQNEPILKMDSKFAEKILNELKQSNYGENNNDEKKSESSTPLSQIWDGRINFGDISSSDDEAEIDALLATAQEVYSSQIHTANIPPTSVLSRSNLYNTNVTMIPPKSEINNVVTTKIVERCRFWPDCRNEDVCPWNHPNKPCLNFPNCWYGDKCLYIHPKCRFGQNCVKLKCPFSHYTIKSSNIHSLSEPTTFNLISKSSQITSSGFTPIATTTSATATSTTTTAGVVKSSTENLQPTIIKEKSLEDESSEIVKKSTKISPLSKAISNDEMMIVPPTSSTSSSILANVLCRFKGKCQNLKCPYKHPPKCRFGLGCLNKSTCYFLHRPAANLTKWNVS